MNYNKFIEKQSIINETKYIIKYHNITIKNIDGKYYAVHKNTDKILIDIYKNYVNKNLYTHDIPVLIKKIKNAIEYHNNINKG